MVSAYIKARFKMAVVVTFGATLFLHGMLVVSDMFLGTRIVDQLDTWQLFLAVLTIAVGTLSIGPLIMWESIKKWEAFIEDFDEEV